jgi:hypothetical protein
LIKEHLWKGKGLIQFYFSFVELAKSLYLEKEVDHISKNLEGYVKGLGCKTIESHIVRCIEPKFWSRKPTHDKVLNTQHLK